MPRICEFFGIVIYMYWFDNDKHKKPHFHAKYGEYEIAVELDTWNIKGNFPKRGIALVLEWAQFHHQELLENWKRMQSHSEMLKIEPLE